ncbi:phosphatidylglycerophosphatase A [candidate division WOR-3 bacterium]|uniref:Phosphatidylglycerophosphatase A n=1 Tax=candidate division WOR-3 bacterium TaxID=2052148 RepID=A0A660SJF2_UNCW3|nr:MAG: phosphatidylglycerophosphatase A [candidate division WOR-3 bacterium]
MGESGATPKALKIIATGFYIGYLPVAPATWASLLTLLIWYLIRSSSIILGLGLLTLLLGCYSANRLSKEWGPDPRPVVIDEIAAMFLLLATVGGLKPGLVGFLLFRVFDVLKPPPIRWAEQIPKGAGIMADDLIAAGYARLVLLLIFRG